MAREVTFDYATSRAVRVDYMQFKPMNNTVSGIEKGDFYCYEIKSSVEDFHSQNGHNFLGDYNYYVMPEEVYEQVKAEIPYGVGVYVPDRLHHGKDWYDLKLKGETERQGEAIDGNAVYDVSICCQRQAKRAVKTVFFTHNIYKILYHLNMVGIGAMPYQKQ